MGLSRKSALSRKTFFRLREMLFPLTRCLCCNKGSLNPVCPSCDQQIEYMKTPFCRICGHSLPAGDICVSCAAEPSPFSSAVYIALYKPPWSKAIVSFKYAGHKSLGRHFARIAYHRFLNSGIFLGVHLIVPVPIDVLRKHQRGFNQCDILANELSYLLDISWEPALIRTQFRPPQVGLSPAQRRENIQGVFAPRNPRLTRGKIILLVDDVFTTGATVREAASALMGRGEAAEVRVLTLSRTYA